MAKPRVVVFDVGTSSENAKNLASLEEGGHTLNNTITDVHIGFDKPEGSFNVNDAVEKIAQGSPTHSWGSGGLEGALPSDGPCFRPSVTVSQKTPVLSSVDTSTAKVLIRSNSRKLTAATVFERMVSGGSVEHEGSIGTCSSQASLESGWMRASPSAKSYKLRVVEQTNECCPDRDDIDINEAMTVLSALGETDHELGMLLFTALDKAQNGLISKTTLVSSLTKLHSSTELDRVQSLFDIFDTERAGSLSRSDMSKMLAWTFREAGLTVPAEETNEILETLMSTADQPGGRLGRSSFVDSMLEQPTDDVDGRFSEPKSRRSPKLERSATIHMTEPTRRERSRNWLETNAKNILVWFLFSSVAVVAFSLSFVNNSTGPKRDLLGVTLPLAKGSAQVLRFVFSLVLFPVSRSLMSYLREVRCLQYVIPFDNRVAHHKALGSIALVAMLVHVGAHCVNYYKWSDRGRADLWRAAFPEKVADGEKQPSLADLWSANISITGLLMCACCMLAVPFASPWPRNQAWFSKCFPLCARCLNSFNAFTVSHQLFLILYAAFVMHPSCFVNPESLCWVGVPVAVHLMDRAWSYLRRHLRPETHLVDVKILPGKVVELLLHKPAGWRSKPGSYLFLNVPSISAWEWHPFSISSAPDDPHISLHIRNLGDWTGALYRMAQTWDQEAQQDLRSSVAASVKQDDKKAPKVSLSCNGVEADAKEGMALPSKKQDLYPMVKIDGPYGAPASGVGSFKVLMLIGAGIGVTPFASVLQDLVHKMKAAKDKKDENIIQIEKVYMFVIVATPEEGTWFKDAVESALQFEDGSRFEYHLHITKTRVQTDSVCQGAHQRLFSSVRSAYHQSTGRDVVTGMRVSQESQAKFGRPNWSAYFEHVIKLHGHGSEIGVFFCGPISLQLALSRQCQKHSVNGTHFRFIAESFRV